MRGAGLGAIGLLMAGQTSAACVDIAAEADWTALPSDGPVIDAYATGLWSAGPSHGRAGPAGYRSVEAARVAPVYPLGALLIASGSRHVWSYVEFSRTVMGALMAGARFEPGQLYGRINDATDGLSDNSGAVTLCLEIGGAAD